MRWLPTHGEEAADAVVAHCLLQTSTAALNGVLRGNYEKWHSELKIERKALE